MSRVFAHGALRLYMLSMLEDHPRHGYELIQLLEDRFLGMYTPSAGTIYPRLSSLEEDGLVEHDVVDGKRVYRLTDAGRAELDARRDEIERITEQAAASARDLAREVRDEVRASVRDLRSELRDAVRDVRREERRSNRRDRTEPDPANTRELGSALDAFVRVEAAWSRIESPPAYLRTAVVNGVRARARRAGVERRLTAEPMRPVLEPELDETWNLLARLPARQRQALVLRFYADLPFADIAELLGCRIGTAKSLVHRGLARMKELVQP